jgi:hypothetical protein
MLTSSAARPAITTAPITNAAMSQTRLRLDVFDCVIAISLSEFSIEQNQKSAIGNR